MNSPLESAFPTEIKSVEELEEVLTRPSDRLIPFMRTLKSPLLILGASGKMGPTLAVLAQRASQAAGHPLEIIAASRFSNAASRQALESKGIRTLACDFLEQDTLSALPHSENVICLVGLKFGTTDNPSLTWAVNMFTPLRMCERFPAARIVALSTGNVYPLVPIQNGGSREGDPLTPAGEYANAAVARERLFEFFSLKHNIPMALLRLNYAVELRYGVLLDVASKVWAGQPIDLAVGYFNCLWQGDANEYIIRSLALAQSPAAVFNMTGSQIVSVRDLALWFGKRMGKPVRFGAETGLTALLNNPAKLLSHLQEPRVAMEQILEWTLAWVVNSRETLGRPTHFEVSDGRY